MILEIDAPTAAIIAPIVRADAAQTPFLAPLVAACDIACPAVTDICLTALVLQRFDRMTPAVNLDPVITSDRYDLSTRAGLDVLRILGLTSRDAPQMQRVALPACLFERQPNR